MRIFPVCLSCFVFALPAFADIQRCGEVWTNRGCSAQSSSEVISEKPLSQQSESERLMSKKRFLFNDLDLRRLKASREYSLTFNVLSAQEACLSQQTTLEDCQRAVNSADEQLDKRIATVLESRKVAAKVKESERPQQTVVTVVENNEKDIYIVKPRRRFRDDGLYEREGFGIQGSVAGTRGDTHYEAGAHVTGRRLSEQRADSPLGSIWKGPGNSFPRTIPTEERRR